MIHKHHNSPPCEAGFTLIELLLYVSISAALLLICSLFLSLLLSSRIKNQTITEVNGQGTQVMQIITQTLRNANSINLPATTTTSSSLSLSMAVAGNNPTIFDMSSGVIQIKEGAGIPVPLTNSRIIASSLLFSNLSRTSTPGTVRIQFTLSSVSPSARSEYSFSKNFIGSATLRQP